MWPWWHHLSRPQKLLIGIGVNCTDPSYIEALLKDLEGYLIYLVNDGDDYINIVEVMIADVVDRQEQLIDEKMF